MGRNIFISYKYRDNKVAPFWNKALLGEQTIVRHYVDDLQAILNKDHFNLGEKDGESLKDFSDEYIESNLKKKIYRSSITIIIISKGMKEQDKEEKDQWIPWEISYSLRVVKREDSTSVMNAIIGVVLPDENNSYDWYYLENSECNCTTHYTNQLFEILRCNMFNHRQPTIRYCNGIKINEGESSFIKTVKWSEFKKSYNYYLNTAIEIRDNKHQYNITINVK